jgi:hypothetical protein
MPLCRAKQVFDEHLMRRQGGISGEEVYAGNGTAAQAADGLSASRSHMKPQRRPMLRASNIQYEMGDRLRGTAVGGMGPMHVLARHTGLVEWIDSHVGCPEKTPAVSRIRSCVEYRLQRAEWRHVPGRHRTAVAGCVSGCTGGAANSPTTAGDFCRRFMGEDIEQLMRAINETRLKVSAQAGRGILRTSDRRCGRNVGAYLRGVQTGDGCDIQGRVGLSPIGDLAG